MSDFFYWLSAKLFDLAGKLQKEKIEIMGTVTTLPTIDPNSLEGKIEQASLEAGQIASTFSPAIGQAIQAGVAFEPLIHSMVSVFANLFKHHAKAAITPTVAPVAAPVPAPAPVIVLPAPEPAPVAPAPVPAPATSTAPTREELQDEIKKLQAELDALNATPAVQATPPAGHPSGL